jgi:hypothetical protein
LALKRTSSEHVAVVVDERLIGVLADVGVLEDYNERKIVRK